MISRNLVSLLRCIPVVALVGCGSSALKKAGPDGGGGLTGTEETTQGGTGGQASTASTRQEGTGSQGGTGDLGSTENPGGTGGQAGTLSTKQGSTGGQGGTGDRSSTENRSGTGGQAGTLSTKQGSTGGQGGTGDRSSTENRGGTGGTSPKSSPSTSSAAECTGGFDTVRGLWGFDCPNSLCDVQAMISNCAGLPANVARLSVRKNFGPNTLFEFEFSEPHGKSCLYEDNSLTAAMAWDDVPSYCNGTSRTITGGAYVTDWRDRATPQICEPTKATQDAGPAVSGTDAGSPAISAPQCFNRLSRTCTPCCPTPVPDCSGKPDGYPGYQCTSTTNAYCICSCSSGTWQCLC